MSQLIGRGEGGLSERGGSRDGAGGAGAVGFWISDRLGRLREVNRDLCRMSGYDESELLSMSVSDLETPEARGRTSQHLARIIETGADCFVVRHRRKNGMVIDVEITANYRSSQGGRFVAFLREIGERLRAEESLVLFKESVENATDAIGMSTPDGRHFYQNEAFNALFGQVGEHPPETLYVDRKVGELVFRTVMEGGRWDGEVKMYGSDRSVHDIHLRAYPITAADGRVAGLVGIHTDITAERQAKDAILRGEQHLEEAQRLAHIGSWEWDAATGVPLWSKELYAILEVDPERPAPTVEEQETIYSTESMRRMHEGIEAAMRDGTPYEIELERIRADGTSRWLLARGEARHDENGAIVGLRGTALDITERKHAEEERDRLQAQLMQAQKMESIGRLAGGVAHDFNNLLGVIIGYAELALGRAAPKDPLREYLGEIRAAAERSAQLTRQLLAFARKQTISPRVVDLNTLIEGMLSMLKRLIGEEVEVSWRPAKELWLVRMDPGQVNQVVANLSVNARDAIAGVGSVTFETANAAFDSDSCREHPGCRPGDYVMLSVSDTGRGMDRETRSRIFEPFYTSKELGRGTGLGLATVYGIVEQNEGFIAVVSAPNRGSTFQVYLPRHRGALEESTIEAPQRPLEGGGETLLVVEDEPAVLEMVKTVIEARGYRVLTAATPGEAIRIFEERAERIDLLITDVVMPEMNGRELAERLLAQDRRLKCLFTSGYTADVIGNRGVLEEGTHFIQKPYASDVLLAKIREALGSA